MGTTFTFSDWFPFPLNMDTFLMFLFTLLLVFAGTVVGIVVKELEVYTPNANPSFHLFTDENRLFLLLAVAISVGFWAFEVPFIECFVYATMLKVSLGTVLNVVFKKRAVVLALTLAKAAVATADAKAKTERDKTLVESLAEAAAAAVAKTNGVKATPVLNTTIPVTEPAKGG